MAQSAMNSIFCAYELQIVYLGHSYEFGLTTSTHVACSCISATAAKRNTALKTLSAGILHTSWKALVGQTS